MTRFAGKLALVLLDDKDHPSIRDGRSLWGLERELGYRTSIGGEGTITVPAGFITDLASMPRATWIALPPDGPWTKAAVIHDFLCTTRGTCVWNGRPVTPPRAKPFTSAEAADILREAMADRGVSLAQRNIIWAGVRVGGPRF